MREPPNIPTRTGGPYQQAGIRDRLRRQYWEEFQALRSVLGGEGTNKSFALRIRNPSAQVRTTISINFEPAAGVPDGLDITGVGNTIWLAATDPNRGGASSQDCPNSSVVGTRAAPIGFPFTVAGGVPVLDNGLLGFSREFVTGAPWITGIVNLGTPPAAGTWVLCATYQPDGVVLPDDAWQEITSLCEAKGIAT